MFNSSDVYKYHFDFDHYRSVFTFESDVQINEFLLL